MCDTGLQDHVGLYEIDDLLQPQKIVGKLNHRPSEPGERVRMLDAHRRVEPGIRKDSEGLCTVHRQRSAVDGNRACRLVDSDHARLANSAGRSSRIRAGVNPNSVRMRSMSMEGNMVAGAAGITVTLQPVTRAIELVRAAFVTEIPLPML